MPIKKLLFVDTNIWLDFYRGTNDTSLKLLRQVEKLEKQLIVTYQLESEFKANRQRVITEGHRTLNLESRIHAPGIFSDAKATLLLEKSSSQIAKQAKRLQQKLVMALNNPAQHDPVYQACQRLFHSGGTLALARNNPTRKSIRSRAIRRFLHNCPPRKRSDVSIGDAINWEWMIECATSSKAELVIVTRDSDYGIKFGDKWYVNDHLRQEFSERVSKKRKLLLYGRLTEALRHFKIQVPQAVEDAEKRMLLLPAAPDSRSSEREVGTDDGDLTKIK